MSNIYGYDPSVDERRSVTAFPALISKVYLWMTLALAMTGLTALYVARNESLLFSIVGNPIVFWGLIIGELAVVMFLSARILKMSFPMAGILFALYSILNGATLSVVLLAYTAESIASTFFVTAGTFGAMSLVGLFIKRDLSSWGRFLMMALVGLIIATLVNIFVASSIIGWALTYIGVFIFCGLTAYDTQKMKEILQQSEQMRDSNVLKIALLCSLSLYLDFINLFLYLLRIFGNRNE